MARTVTIKSIAAELGVSHMTVSRALAGNPNVREQTRAAIVKRAAELGYVASAAARAMRGDQVGIIGVVLPNITNEFYAQFANALAHRCAAQGLSPVIHLTDDDPRAEDTALQRLREIQARTVFMVPAPRDTALAPMPSDPLRIVDLVRHRPGGPASAAVTIDDSAALQAAVAHVAARGCRRIAYIGGTPELSTGRSRFDAYLAGLSAAGIARDENLIRLGMPSFELGQSDTAHLLTDAAPDALITGGFEISNGALECLLHRGVNLPDDIAFVGYGDSPFYRWVGGGVTTIALPIDDLADDAIALVDGHDAPLENRVRKAQLRPRKSA